MISRRYSKNQKPKTPETRTLTSPNQKPKTDERSRTKNQKPHIEHKPKDQRTNLPGLGEPLLGSGNEPLQTKIIAIKFRFAAQYAVPLC